MVHNGGSRAGPAHGLRITTHFSASPPTLGGVACYMAKTFPAGGLSAGPRRSRLRRRSLIHCSRCVIYYCRTYYKAVRVGVVVWERVREGGRMRVRVREMRCEVMRGGGAGGQGGSLKFS
jgi:hypothetical protein